MACEFCVNCEKKISHQSVSCSNIVAKSRGFNAVEHLHVVRGTGQVHASVLKTRGHYCSLASDLAHFAAFCVKTTLIRNSFKFEHIDIIHISLDSA